MASSDKASDLDSRYYNPDDLKTVIKKLFGYAGDCRLILERMEREEITAEAAADDIVKRISKIKVD